MNGASFAGARRILSTTAGKTTSDPNPITPLVHPIAEQLSEFASKFSGGPHPETPLRLFNSTAIKATDSIRGPHGGTVPRLLGPLAPGPAGSVTAAQNVKTQNEEQQKRPLKTRLLGR